jgi:hypothetical protein
MAYLHRNNQLKSEISRRNRNHKKRTFPFKVFAPFHIAFQSCV